jgi:hypothetical protein
MKYILSKFFLIRVVDEDEPDKRGEQQNQFSNNVTNSTSKPSINPQKVEEICQFLVQKRGSDRKIQDDFLKEVDKLIKKYKISGETNVKNFKFRLGNLSEEDYQTL